MSTQRLYIFAKAPIPGRVKTRLGLDPALAAQLAAAGLRDTRARHARPGRAVTIWAADALDHPFWATLDAPLRAQIEGDLGARMAAALQDAPTRAAPIVLIGADCPTLPPERVDEAFARLQDHDLTLIPAEDGGYCLIGASIPPPAALFEGIAWGEAGGFEQTMARIEAAGLSVAALDPWFDLDRPQDLARLEAEPGDPPAEATLRLLQQADPRYCATLSALFGRLRFGEKLNLPTPKALNTALGEPLSAYRSVIIGGTNGKGSAAATLEALLLGRGLRVGLFTSPHLNSFTERIRVNGAALMPRAVIALFEAVIAAAEAAALRPSFFEAVWGMAAYAFAKAGVEVVIWEVGLGGRLDATNACDPVASGVTSLGLDHTEILGDTIEAIAYEKAGIFRAGRPALTCAQGPALDALRAAWPAVISAPPLPPEASLALAGAHQRQNAALAWALARALGVEPRVEDLGRARWPGRMERVGDVLLDCAHNPHAMEALCAALRAAELAPLHVVFGAMQDKDIAGMASLLRGVAASVALVTPAYPRRASAASLAPHFEGQPGLTLYEDVISALEARPRGRLTLVVGSCFLVAEVRAWIYALPQPECGISTKAR